MGSRQTLAIGLTGGIGSGKSRVAELLRERGAVVECSDQIVRELQAPGGVALAEIVTRFGEEYLLASGELDRSRLGELVFGDPQARRKLGDIMHPLVYRELAKRLEDHRQRGARVVVLDIPLLLEGRASGRGSGALLPLDLVVVVYADEETQLARIMARDQLSREDALSRVRAQLSIEKKRGLADVVIDNSGDWESAAKQVRECYAEWISGEAPNAAPR
jgi:dephospho-CoA kinase